MTASTFYVAEAEARGTLADGFQWDMQDITKGKNGTLVPTVPYFQRPGEEKTWAGAGGVLSSARDLATWVSMLLNKGRHPYTNQTIIPEEVIDHVAYGRSVSHGKPEFPELSPKVYGAGQWRYSYQSHDIIEHGGNNPGYKTQVARFPDDNLAVITLSNDANGGFIIEAVKFRIADELLGLKELDWNDRYEKQWNEYIDKAQQLAPRPSLPNPPTLPFAALAEATYTHPTYGILQPCAVPETIDKPLPSRSAHKECKEHLKSWTVQRIITTLDFSAPSFIIPWKRTFATHIRLTHFSGNVFNATILWSNADVRAREGFSQDGDLLIGFDEHFEVEWVNGEGEEEGLAFKGGFWGKEGLDSRSPTGKGKESAEVWFAKL
ncbi:beta-lactamase/transpeptidase-like protein [Pholiota conissans]|uniref:Beta-lactamase/transpeptidase-like protein n=1 Tax=Pholiota conissans TaxID=109636 RepID=A0A9P5YLK2_9AGAR|nr:beta-lactamase/transpeptidase-like protein [Pholiota conissans]